LCQSTHWKIQSLDLEKNHRENELFYQLCRMFDELAIFPVRDVSEGFDFLKSTMPQEASGLVYILM